MHSGRSWGWIRVLLGRQVRAITRAGSIPWFVAALLAVSFASTAAHAQAREGFNWVDLRADTHTVEIATKALRNEHYTALREIGFLGAPPAETADAPSDSNANATTPFRLPVPVEAHLLIVTSTRATPAALPQDDTYAAYDVDQTSGAATLILSGAELRFAGWLRLRRDGEPELVATYADCVECQKTVFLTAFYPDAKTKAWTARWPRSRAGAPVYSEGQEANGGQEVYTLLDDDAGRVMLGTWQHFAGRKRRDSDFLYEYTVDNYTGQEFTQPLAGADARALESRLCHAQGVVLGIAGGQGSEICKTVTSGSATSSRSTRPPARRTARR